ncbi:MAG: ATP-binding cassette domain-containing protein, partial [Clostridium sp.]
YFSYTPDKPLLRGLSAEVKAGQMVAIVGPTGVGKTTLINLLMRFYDVTDGSIKIDGIDICHMGREDLRSKFGMVLQDTWLFRGTIRDNIAYGKDNAAEEEIVRAAKIANVHHFITTLPEGYDMVLNEEASNISQGEKQLLTIARAILCDPPILILDEATSSVDTRLEQMLQNAMQNIMKGRTSFVIAHRLSTIKNADLILVMSEGNIVEQGTHEELLEKKGYYEQLYHAQFSGMEEEIQA